MSQQRRQLLGSFAAELSELRLAAGAHDVRALELYEQAQHERGRASALNAVGWDLAQRGEYESTRTRSTWKPN